MIRIPPRHGGWLEVICGPMFSGKSEEMIRRLRRAEIAGQRIVIFKPRIDDRFDATDVVSHAGVRMHAVAVDKLQAVCHRCGGTATTTQRLVEGRPAAYSGETVVVGAEEQYEARCRDCHEAGADAITLVA